MPFGFRGGRGQRGGLVTGASVGRGGGIQVRTRAQQARSTHTHTHTHIMYVCMYVCIYIYITYIHTYIHTYILCTHGRRRAEQGHCTPLHPYKVCTYIYIYVHIYVCIYAHIGSSSHLSRSGARTQKKKCACRAHRIFFSPIS